jgi:hypothetical protein
VRWLWPGVLAFSGALACSPYHEAHSVAELQEGAVRVVVVEVVMERTSVSAQVGGAYLGSNLVVAKELPFEDGRPAFEADSGHEVDTSSFSSDGGIVAFGGGRGPFYVLGVRAASTMVLWNTTTFLPFVTHVPRAKARCEYAGTIHVWGPSRFVVRNELEAHFKRLRAAVRGCELVPNVGHPSRYQPR